MSKPEQPKIAYIEIPIPKSLIHEAKNLVDSINTFMWDMAEEPNIPLSYVLPGGGFPNAIQLPCYGVYADTALRAAQTGNVSAHLLGRLIVGIAKGLPEFNITGTINDTLDVHN